MLNEKLDSLVRELNDESQAIVVPEGSTQSAPPGPEAKESSRGGSFNPSPVPRIFKSKEQLMLRANSLKKALRQIIEQAEKGKEPGRGRKGLQCRGSARLKASARSLAFPIHFTFHGWPPYAEGSAGRISPPLSCRRYVLQGSVLYQLLAGLQGIGNARGQGPSVQAGYRDPLQALADP